MSEEKQGAAEWLRGIADKYEAGGGVGCREIAELFGLCCDEIGTCQECRVKEIRAIADRIDAERALPEGIEWPRFEDGELVRPGDEVGSDEPFTAEEIAFEPERWLIKASSRSVCGYFHGAFGEPVKRPTPEVLDADGVPIEVGDTVYGDDDPEPLVVDSFDGPGCVCLTLAKSPSGMLYTIEPSRLTHERHDSWERIEEDAKLAPRAYLEARGMNPEKTERVASMMADLVRRAKAIAKAGEQG